MACFRAHTVSNFSIDLAILTAMRYLHLANLFIFESSSAISNQFELRYPLSSPLSPPFILWFLHCACLIISLRLLQLFSVHSKTRHKLQKSSKTCIYFISANEGVCLTVLFLSMCHKNNFNRFNIFTIDFVYFFSLAGYFFSVFRLLPQVALNFSSRIGKGYSKFSVVLELISSCLEFFCGVYFSFHRSMPYPGPQDCSTYSVSITAASVQIASCAILLYQRKIYKPGGSKPQYIELDSM